MTKFYLSLSFTFFFVLSAFEIHDKNSPYNGDYIAIIFLDPAIRAPVNLFQTETTIELSGLEVGVTYSVTVNSAEKGTCRSKVRLLETDHQNEYGQSIAFKATGDKAWLLAWTDCPGSQLYYISVSSSKRNDKPVGGTAPASNNHNPPPISTNSAVTPTFMVQNVLIGGNCFNVSGATFSGNATQRGTFSNGLTSVGFSTGIILATGNINIATGPNNNTGASGGFGTPGNDPDLDALTGGNLFDVAKLEFNFIPTVDTISFEYVFASEEYCDYVGSIFNDVFGFFISGPGITGTQNIATIPGSGTYVSINNVNHNTNSAYYVGNIPPTGGASGQLFDIDCFGHPTTNAASTSDCQFDGYTTVMTAKRAVQPCQTYHIKLAISDVGDGVFDSAVFLKANSFDAGGFATGQVVSSNPGGVIYEGCGGGSFVFIRQGGDINQPLTITYTISSASTATSGSDYTPITTTITIPAGQSSVTLPVNVILDNIPEGTETIILELSNPCQCSQEQVIMNIQDPPPVNLSLQDVVTCSGSSVTLTPSVSGGVAPLQYAWSTGQNSGSISVTQSGTYAVTVTDACGSSQTADADVTIESAPTALIGGNVSVCNGVPSGGQMSVAFTGIGPWVFQYSINNIVQPTVTTSLNPYIITVSQPGNYQLVSVGYPGGACPGQVSGSSNVTTTTLNLNSSTQNIDCAGGADGSINLNASGGNAPYTFNWSDGLPSQQNQSGLAAGSYSVTVTDQNGCSNNTVISLTEAPPLQANVNNPQDATCVQNGSASLSVSGGTPGYTYQWNNGGGTSPNPGNLQPGDYTVTVTDNAGCTTTAEVTIGENTIPPLAVVNGNGLINCYQNTLQLNSTGSSSGSGITYNWSGSGIIGPNTGATITVNQAGTYTITVTNNTNGCTATDNITIDSDNTPPVADIQPPLLLDCNNTSVQLDATGSDSGPGYSFQWSSNVTSGQNTLTPTVTNAATYTITVTNTVNGCTATDNITVSQNNTPPTVNILTPPQLTCTTTSLNLSGSGSSTGPGFSYQWTSPNGSIVSGENTLTPLINSPGTYILTIYNSQNGCEQSGQITVSANTTPPILNTGPDAYLNCNYTSVNLSANASGNGSISINWQATNGGNIVSGANTSSPLVNAAGDYIVTATNNSNGCTATDVVQVSVDMDMPDAEIAPPGIVTCDQPILSISATGSSTGNQFTYQWGTTGGNIMGNGSGFTVSITQGGIYTVTVTNTANGCTSTASLIVPEDQVYPDADGGPDAMLTCTQNTAQLNGVNSSVGAGLIYNWSTTNGYIVSGANTLYPIVNMTGTYTLQITNTNNGCSSFDNVLVTTNDVIPNANAGPDYTLNCELNIIELQGSGTTGAAYSYSWTTLDGHIVSGANTASPEVDAPGTYIFTVTNTQNGCQQTDQTIVDTDFTAPIANAGQDNSLDCTVSTLNISGSASGASNVSLQWTASNGGNIVSGATSSVVTVNAAGTYTLTVTNQNNGCTAQDLVVISSNMELPLVNIPTPGTITCNNTLVNLLSNVGGNGSNFIYQWSTQNGNIVGNTTNTTASVDQGGTYQVIVTDIDNGCTGTAAVAVAENTIAPGAAAGSDALITCTQPVISLNAGNPGAGMNYLWTTPDGNIVSGNNTLQPSIDQPGTYIFTVTNPTNGCSSTDQALVTTDANVPIANIATPAVINCSAATVQLNGTNSSSGAGFNFNWSTPNGNISSGSNTLTPSVDAPGTYVLTVNNSINGCTTTDTAVVNADLVQPDPDINAPGELNCQINSIQIDATGSTSGSGISYQWTTSDGNFLSGANTLNPTVDAPGNYTLTINNSNNGCSASQSVTVDEDTVAPDAVIAPPSLLTCTNTQINLNTSGSSSGPGFNYSWTTNGGNIVSGQGTLNLTVNAAGDYQLLVTNTSNMCTDLALVTVASNAVLPVVNAGTANTLNCQVNTLQLNGSASGSNNLSIQWSTADGFILSGANTLTPSIQGPGNYVLQVTNNDNNCSAQSSVLVNQDIQPPVAAAGNPATLTCVSPSMNLNGNGSSSGAAYAYSWTTLDGNITSGEYTLTPTVNAAGTYTILVTNTLNQCTASSSVLIGQDAGLPVADAGLPQVINCTFPNITIGGSNTTTGPGIATVWTNETGNTVGNAPTLSINTPGIYYLTVTNNANGCESMDEVQVLQNNAIPVVNAGTDEELSCSLLELQLNASASGNTQNFVYQWTSVNGNIVAGQGTLNPLIDDAGDYQLQVTDTTNGCFSSDLVVVTQDNNVPVAVITPPGLLNCDINSIVLNGSGSSQGVNYQLNWTTADGHILSGGSTYSPVVDEPGIYTLQITDLTNNCINSSSVNVMIDTLHPAAMVTTPLLTCAVSSGPANAVVTTPGVDYTFQWQEISAHIASGANTSTPVIDQAGQLTLSIENNTNGCQTQLLVEVFENTLSPLAEAGTAPALTCTVSQSPLDGSGSSSGVIYTYAWTEVSSGTIISNSLNATANAIGDYQLEVTNTVNGCSSTDLVTVIQNDQPPVVNTQPAALLTCVVNSIQLDGSGSSTGPQYTYAWTTSNGFIVSGANTIQPTVNAVGVYQLMVTDINNQCTDTETVVVTNDLNPPLAEAGLPSMLTCSMTQTSLSGSSSTPGVSFYWTTPNGNIVSGQNTASPLVNAQGIYELHVVNNLNGCESTDTVSVSQDASIPVANAGAPQLLTCDITSVMLNGYASSTGPEYVYQWGTVNGIIQSGDNTLEPVIASPGTYTITVTNTLNNCTSIASVLVDSDTSPPLANAGPGAELNCDVSTITLDGSGSAAANAVYSWTTANGVILSGQNTLQPIVGAPGTYTLEVTSQINGCAAVSDVVIGQSSDLPVVLISAPDVLTCAINSINLDASQSSGGAGFTYLWSTVDGNIVSGANTVTPVIDAPGSYQLLVTNTTNGCDNIQSITVIEDDLAPTVDAGSGFMLDCNTTSTGLSGTASGGLSLQYNWTTANGNIVSGANSPNPVIDAPGTYLLTVVNQANGCSSTDEVMIDEDTDAPNALIVAPEQLTCVVNQVVLDADNSSQGSQFSYNWTTSNGNIVDSSDPLHPVVNESGTYALTVINLDNGCEETISVDVSANMASPIVDAGPAIAIECDEATASLLGNATGTGGGGMQIIWSTSDGQIVSGGASLNPVVGLPGTYALLVTDLNNGCTAQDLVEVTKEALPELEAVKTDPECHGLKGNIQFTSVAGGNPPFLYSIDGGESYSEEDFFILLSPGTYPLVVLDAHGCVDVDTLTIVEPVELTVELESRVVLQFGDSYQIETIVNYPLDQINSIEWTPSTGLSCTDCLNPVATPLESTTYTVIIRNENNCEDRANIEILLDLYPAIYVPNVFSPNEDGFNDIFTIYVKDNTVTNIKSFFVYDRWGETVHEYHDMLPNQPVGGWDGKFRGEMMNPQVYAWWAEVELIDGRVVLIEGDVTLVR